MIFFTIGIGRHHNPTLTQGHHNPLLAQGRHNNMGERPRQFTVPSQSSQTSMVMNASSNNSSRWMQGNEQHVQQNTTKAKENTHLDRTSSVITHEPVLKTNVSTNRYSKNSLLPKLHILLPFVF